MSDDLANTNAKKSYRERRAEMDLQGYYQRHPLAPLFRERGAPHTCQEDDPKRAAIDSDLLQQLLVITFVRGVPLGERLTVNLYELCQGLGWPCNAFTSGKVERSMDRLQEPREILGGERIVSGYQRTETSDPVMFNLTLMINPRLLEALRGTWWRFVTVKADTSQLQMAPGEAAETILANTSSHIVFDKGNRISDTD